MLASVLLPAEDVVPKPLAHARVLTLALNVPGPVAASRLRRLGAGVTKVEPPEGDPLGQVAQAWYAELHAGQDVLRLDLKAESDRLKLDALLEQADLLLTAQRPAALARLGLAWTELHPRLPRLSQVAIVGHPAPQAHLAGHDLTYVAPLGLLRPPELPRTLVADLGGAERVVTAALALLLRRESSAGGAYAEIALADVARDFAAPLRHGLTTRDGILGGAHAAYSIYAARDGWIAVGALEPQFQERLRDTLGLNDLTRETLARTFERRGASDWEAWARENDLPIAAVREGGE